MSHTCLKIVSKRVKEERNLTADKQKVDLIERERERE